MGFRIPPRNLEITAIGESENSISICLKSRIKHCVCQQYPKALSKHSKKDNKNASPHREVMIVGNINAIRSRAFQGYKRLINCAHWQ